MRRLLVLFLLLLPVATAAQQTADRLPVDPNVTVGTLPNGLRYYIRVNTRPEKRAELRLAVNAGSILEDETQQGLAHFVEHMAFNGTKNFAKQEIVGYLESIGMRFGSHLNAYTSFDETVYMLQLPTDDAEALRTGVRILGEWAHNVTFDAAEVDKERGVVIEEWRLGQGADERMRKQYWPILFRDSRYAERLPIGQVSVLESFPREELLDFYRDWYRPDLMAVIAVGDFDRDVVEQLIREEFGAIPMAPAPRARVEATVPAHEETLVAIATDPEATSTAVQVMWKLPPQEQTELATYRTSLVTSLYDAMLNARFGEIAQKPDAPFIGAGSSYGSFVRSVDAYMLGAAVQEGGVERALEAVVTEGERVAQHGFTVTELERQKTNLLRGFERAFAERDKSESAGYADEYVRAFLEQEPIPGIEREYQLVQQLLPGIQLAELNALARAWMTERNRVVLVMAPQRPETRLPTQEQLLAVLERVEAKPITPYEDVVANVALLETPPTPGRIVSSKPVAGIANATLLELSNGAKVYLMPTTYKNDQVVMSAYSPGGLSLVGNDDYMSAGFAGQLVALSGLGGLDAIQLQKALTGKVAQVSAAVGEFGEMMSGAASPQDLETLFQQVYLNFTAPRSDSAAFASFMQRIQGFLANRGASPEAAFADTFALTLWQYHPRARPTTAEVVGEIDRNEAFRYFRERFANAGDFTFAFVGAFDADAIRPLVERYLASLPSTATRETPRDNGMRPVRGVVEKTVVKGVEPKAQTRITFTGPLEYNRDNRVALDMMVDVLDMKLRDVLREDLGGTYGVSISQSAARLPEPRYTISIAFGSAPERLEELVSAVFAEIEKLKAEGPTAEALAKVKEQQRRDFETAQQQNGFWMSLLIGEAESGEPAANALQHNARVEAMTAERIRDAARLWLDITNYVRVDLVPITPRS